MKKFLAISIICSLMFQCLVHLGILSLYELRKDYIAKHLCENRNRPELKCCGKCYLKKQLKKADDTDASKNGPVKAEKQEWVVFILPVAPVTHQPEVFNIEKNYPFTRQSDYRYSFANDIFHPPSALLYSC